MIPQIQKMNSGTLRSVSSVFLKRSQFSVNLCLIMLKADLEPLCLFYYAIEFFVFFGYKLLKRLICLILFLIKKR